jgi:hypothetical protein
VNATARPGPVQPPPNMQGGNPGGGLTATSQFNTPRPQPNPPMPGAGGGASAPPPSVNMAPPGVAPAAAVGAGSYTQMMQAPTAPRPLIGQTPAAGKPAAAPKKGISPIVFIAAGLIVFLIIVVILVVVMRKPA